MRLVTLTLFLLAFATLSLHPYVARAADRPRTSIFDFGDDDEDAAKPQPPLTIVPKTPDPQTPEKPTPTPPPVDTPKPPEIVVMRPSAAVINRIRLATPRVVKLDVLKPVPDAKVQEAALKLIKEQFKDEYRTTGAAQRVAVAVKLMQAGIDDKMDADTGFVLLKEARDMASLAGDARTGLVAARHISSRYETDLTEMGLGVLMAASRAATTPDKAAEVAEVAMSLLNRAIGSRQFDLANRIAGIAEASARFMRSTPLVGNIQALSKDLLSRKTNADKLAAAQETLKTKPTDPDANTVVGRQLCLEEGNWSEGLPYWAKCGDATLKNLALKEAASPTDPLPRAELAGLWWAAAQNQPVTGKLRMQERAAYWYTQALPGLIKKDQATARIAAARRVLAEVVIMQLPLPTEAAAARRERDAQKKGDPLPKDKQSITQTMIVDAGKPQLLSGQLSVPDKNENIDIILPPGAEMRGGKIYLAGRGHMKLQGSPEKPAVLRNVEISMDLGGSFEAENAVLDGCSFSKAGGWFSYHSSRWIFKNTVLYKCKFPRLTGVDYGIQFDNCRMIGMTFPEIIHRREPGKEFFHLDHLRKGMNHIAQCEFDDCQVPPTVAWCAEDSNFIGCKFLPGEAFEGRENFEWTAFVAETIGDLPQAAFDAHPGPRAKVIALPADRPAEVTRIGEKLIPEIVYSTKAVKRND